MININLEWRRPLLSGSGTLEDPYIYGNQFNVNLELVESNLKSNFPEVQSISAANELKIHCLDSLSDENRLAIINYWESISEVSEEATTYISKESIKSAINSAKEDMVLKSYDELSVAQKKILMGLEVTREDLGL